MLAIYKRELRSFFSSMIGYVYIAIVMIFIGIYFMAYNLITGYPYFSQTLSAVISVFIFTVPILTMKSLAEDRKNKTDQLLLTAPVTVTAIVLGKYFALMTVFFVPMVFCMFCPLIISTFGNFYFLGDYIAIFAFICLGGALISIGLFISSLTENQIISAVGTFGVLLFVLLWDGIIDFIPTSYYASFFGCFIILGVIVLLLHNVSRNQLLSLCVGAVGALILIICFVVDKFMFMELLPNVLKSLSFTQVLYNFALYSVFDLGGLFLYLSTIVLFIFLTVQSVQRRRWY